mgnify:CR=1 FL=1
MDPPQSQRTRGVVGVAERQGELLVIRRSQQVAAPGRLCFPGGGIQPGETEPQALRRELREELGIRVLPVRRLWQSQTSWEVELSWWLMLLPEGRELSPNQLEVAEFFWMAPSVLARHDDLLESNLDFLAALSRGDFALS